MKKMVIGMIGMAAILVAVPETMAGNGHRDRGGNEGLRLAAGIVHLVKEVIAPTPVVVTPAPVPVVAPAPRVVIQKHRFYEPPRRREPPRRHKPERPGKKGHRR